MRCARVRKQRKPVFSTFKSKCNSRKIRNRRRTVNVLLSRKRSSSLIGIVSRERCRIARRNIQLNYYTNPSAPSRDIRHSQPFLALGFVSHKRSYSIIRFFNSHACKITIRSRCLNRVHSFVSSRNRYIRLSLVYDEEKTRINLLFLFYTVTRTLRT